MSESTSELLQTIIAASALLAAVYTLILQRRELRRSQELTAASSLLDYYNAKIGSLRGSIVRDAGDAAAARLDSLERRKERLDELLDKHERVRLRLEELYDEAAG